MRKLVTLVSTLMLTSMSSIAAAQNAPPADMPPMASEGGGTLPDVVGHIGAGYFTTTAPLGVRYWFKEGQGFDAGIGLNINKAPAPSGGPGADTDTTIGFEGGYLHSVAQSQNLNLFIRPGLGVLEQSVGGASNFSLNVNFSLCGEMFLTGLGLPHVSLTAGLGAAIALLAPEGNDTGFGFSFANTGASIVSSSALIGAHLYF